MATESVGDRLRTGQVVQDSEGQTLGKVAEVWADVGVGEAWGGPGAIPMEGAEAADRTEFAYSEAMPGEGESYFRPRLPRRHRAVRAV